MRRLAQLHDFYASPIGRASAARLSRLVRSWWPDLAGRRVLGLGYAMPVLEGPGLDGPARGAERVLYFAPAEQGGLRWPSNGPNKLAVVESVELPLPDLSIDRAVLVHALEHEPQTQALIRELWRVLKDDGRLLVIVPNRAGLWARFDSTPFGLGAPWSLTRLSHLLEEGLFLPEKRGRALYFLPLRWRIALLAAPIWDRIGRLLWPMLGGVVAIEAAKHVHGVLPVMERSRRLLRLMLPVSATPQHASLSRESPTLLDGTDHGL